MLKLYLRWVYAFLNILSILGQSNKPKGPTTTPNPLNAILSKFYQSDYKLNYEWAETVRFENHYVDYSRHVFKYNRTTTALNTTIFLKVNFGFDIEAIGQVYRFASNEYRLYPIRLQLNFCDLMEKQIMGFEKFNRNGNFTCPLLKGKLYHCYNWTPESSSFPPFIPTGKYMLEMQFLHDSKEFLVTRDYGSIYRPFV